MSATLYPYYEQELHFIRHEAEEFAKQYPAAAGQLLLERNQSRDPHVERLIEAFALLSARVEKKLDDEFPEITDGMLAALYPHYLAPIPSMAIAQFDADPASPQPNGMQLPRGSAISSPLVEGVACRYRTCYPVTLWPVHVTEAALEFAPFDKRLKPPAHTAGILRIRLETDADLPFSELTLDSLLFHLQGDDALTAVLYEQLLNRATRVEVHSAQPDDRRLLGTLSPEQALSPVGFADDESLLPYPPQSSKAYRLLTELFSFPQKFSFVDVRGLNETLKEAAGQIDLVIYLSEADERLAGEVNAETFRLGCTPVVNLFEKVCEPIRLTQTKTEYQVIPDVHHRDTLEVYSVNQVTGIGGANASTRYTPLYGLDHENSWSGDDEAHAYWHTRRRPSLKAGDTGTDVSLRLVDLDFEISQPAEQSVTVRATCTNRDLPSRIPSGPAGLRFQMDEAFPVRSVRCLRQPTAPMHPPLGKQAHWRLISHLSLNHLSLSGGTAAKSSLQEMLRLYDFADQGSSRSRAIINSEMIDGIVSVATRRTACRIGGPQDGGFCRGNAIELELDEENFRSVGAYLFASVLERFFAEYTTVNSFTKLTYKSKQNGIQTIWPPRSGDTPLV